ncbi:hypothetical protein HDU96_002475 [Phlyctochytrium bullatum]|nr:hypothetical protein HDU96_002475 [Phlyctochytrium bullatum]
MPSIEAIPTELLQGIVLHRLSPLEASRLMITSRTLRSALNIVPFAQRHLISYIKNHCLLDPPPYEDNSLLPTVGGTRVDWSRIRWEDGVNEVYWAAVFAEFGVFQGMEVVAKAHRTVWTEGRPKALPLPNLTLEYIDYQIKLLSSMFSGGSTNHTTDDRLRRYTKGPDALLDFISALPTTARYYLPYLLTLLAYLDCVTVMIKVLNHYKDIPLDDDQKVPNQHLIAAGAGSLQSLLVLLDHYPIDLSANDSEVFRMAARNGHANVLRFLLEQSATAPSVSHSAREASDKPENFPLKRSMLDPGAKKSQALRDACFHGHANVVKMLLDHSLTAMPLGLPCVDASAKCGDALRVAVWKGSVEVVKLLLDHSLAAAPLGIPCIKPLVHNTDSFQDAFTNRHEIIKLLLDHSLAAPPVGVPGIKTSAYMDKLLRTYCGDSVDVKLLLDHSLAATPLGIPSANPSANGSAALRDACMNGHAAVVKLLLDHSRAARPLGIPCVDPSVRDSKPLRNAILGDHAETVKLLLDHSLEVAPLGLPYCDPSVSNSELLREATRKSFVHVVEVLLDHSLAAAPLGLPHVDPAACNSQVLLDALESYYPDRLIKLLLDHTIAAAALGIPGVDPSVNDSQALREASRLGYTETVKLLLDHMHKAKQLGIPCVDPAARDNEALRIARGNGNGDIIKLLEEYEQEQ